MLRAAKPKLSLAVPTTSVPTHTCGPCSPLTFNRSPVTNALTPTTRNTMFNQRGLAASTAATASFVTSNNKSGVRITGKRVQFSNKESVKCISPLPKEYYGEWVGMSRDEKKWGKK